MMNYSHAIVLCLSLDDSLVLQSRLDQIDGEDAGNADNTREAA